MAEEPKKPLVFTSEGQVARPISEIEIPAPPRQWRRWVSMLRQISVPSIWSSDAFAFLLFGIAATAAVAAGDRWLGWDFTETIEQVERIKLRNLIPAILYTVFAIAGGIVGIVALAYARRDRTRDESFARLVADEMDEHLEAHEREIEKAQREEKRRAKEQIHKNEQE